MADSKKPFKQAEVKQSEELQKLETEVVRLNPGVFNGLPVEKRHQIIRSVASITMTMHAGPLPTPEALREYAEIIPDGANRIMIMAENQSKHRIDIENSVVSSQMKQSERGQLYALIVSLLAISGSVVCVLMGHEWGSILGLGGLVGLASVFIKGKSDMGKDLDRKNPKQPK